MNFRPTERQAEVVVVRILVKNILLAQLANNRQLT